jgi:hypothetical protein
MSFVIGNITVPVFYSIIGKPPFVYKKTSSLFSIHIVLAEEEGGKIKTIKNYFLFIS